MDNHNNDDSMTKNGSRQMNKFSSRVKGVSHSPPGNLNSVSSPLNQGGGSRPRPARPSVGMIDRESRSAVTPMNDSMST